MIYASVNYAIFGSDTVWRQAVIWTNAGLLSKGPLGTNWTQILIEINSFSLKKMHLKSHMQDGGHFVLASMC